MKVTWGETLQLILEIQGISLCSLWSGGCILKVYLSKLLFSRHHGKLTQHMRHWSCVSGFGKFDRIDLNPWWFAALSRHLSHTVSYTILFDMLGSPCYLVHAVSSRTTSVCSLRGRHHRIFATGQTRQSVRPCRWNMRSRPEVELDVG